MEPAIWVAQDEKAGAKASAREKATTVLVVTENVLAIAQL